ncbi:hypothetical protein Kpol_1018p174 [Vanderwaltozyma polyspora DSM 70294]|uniref:Uncharacterized protein n=1 Tax=Vanderwaltozyma polyspora (strain ATCC 22028 / DSM 70294 / BCRC 21397 / CBS 2163 / NBRC 10782 / NRRL Y-8283 / UCD 57-17) TaxID=436907 RepID=A7TE14_VANPO|nr:uncharacterized protein Kpol_1018p174 [Vanderwaltozyma polyspora DSM 70294]EDO19634.1 hypothetical protein Kpol_1018p174 [Vanderwaltozyma polyspora DSM 70294]
MRITDTFIFSTCLSLALATGNYSVTMEQCLNTQHDDYVSPAIIWYYYAQYGPTLKQATYYPLWQLYDIGEVDKSLKQWYDMYPYEEGEDFSIQLDYDISAALDDHVERLECALLLLEAKGAEKSDLYARLANKYNDWLNNGIEKRESYSTQCSPELFGKLRGFCGCFEGIHESIPFW